MSDRVAPDGARSGWQSVGGVIEQLTFGTDDERRIDELVGDFAVQHLGAPVSDVLFRSSSSHVVYGVQLADGRRVVVKGFARTASDDLLGTQAVQRHLHASGYPCPEPLLGPRPVGQGVAVAERFVDQGEMGDTHDPAVRRLTAEALAWHLHLVEDLTATAGAPAGWDFAHADAVWPPQAHSAAIDLRSPVAGVGRIERLATLAQAAGRRTALSGERRLAGHHDWSGKHFRFADGQVTAVYDWDSVMLGREAVIVGNAAMTHTANYDLPGVPVAPTPDEVLAFVDDYSHARVTPLSRAEREAIAAAATYIGAYTARCEAAVGAAERPFTEGLHAYGQRYLRT